MLNKGILLEEKMEPVDNILNFWFGRIEETVVPSEKRTRIWFSEDTEVGHEIQTKFKTQLDSMANGDYTKWNSTPRGRLAAIIVLDQFSRHIHRNTSDAFTQDNKALEICLQGINQDAEHNLSLIERVFYYFPLLHSEKLVYQEQAVIAYQVLSELAFEETKIIYDSFLKFANHHYTIIQRYGRFPQRNALLGRTSTPEELAYLKEQEDLSDEQWR